MTQNSQTVSDTELLARAAQLGNQGRLGDAVKLANQAARGFPSNPEAWFLLSRLNSRHGAVKEAADNAQRAIALRPEQASYHAQLARCFTMLQQKHLALNAAKQAAALKPRDAESLDAVAAILTLCDEQELAAPLAEKAVELEPENSFYRYNLATLQRMLGQTEAAEINCDKVIALTPHDYRAYFTRADLRKQTHENNHISEIEAVLGGDVKNWRGEMLLHFALAKERDDIGDHAASFTSQKRACDLQRQHMDYDVNEDVAAIEHIIASHTAEAFAKKSSDCNSREPIFVLGLPRSGTTLVERILNSHSQVFAAGELQDFAAVLVKAAQGQGGKQQMSKLQMIEKVLDLDLTVLGQAYIDSTRPRTGHTAHFIDKLPLNYLYCGLIHAALPQAKIIVLKRNPMDSCYSMYKAMFHSAYPFTYDLNDLGQYYCAWHRLMKHWQDVIGESLLTVQYEDLVNDQEELSRTLIDFCGLDWEDACLEFYRNESASSTASAIQVRQPIYRSSIGKWKLYRQQLAPLEKLFQSAGIDVE